MATTAWPSRKTRLEGRRQALWGVTREQAGVKMVKMQTTRDGLMQTTVRGLELEPGHERDVVDQ